MLVIAYSAYIYVINIKKGVRSISYIFVALFLKKCKNDETYAMLV